MTSQEKEYWHQQNMFGFGATKQETKTYNIDL